jgi:hypothetical protein
MRVAQVSGASGAGQVVGIHSADSVEAIEEFLSLRGIGDRAISAPSTAVQVGTVFDGTAFAQPSPPPEPEPMPEPEPASLTAESVVWWIESKYQALLAEFPEGEKKSWDTQVKEAEALLRNSQALTPFIDSQAAITGESRAELAQKVLQKAGELSAFSGVLTGIRRQAIGRIQNSEQLLAEDLETILAAALGGQ